MAEDERDAGNEPDRISIYEMSAAVRHYEIAFGGSGLARLYVEIFADGGAEQSTARLHFDGDIRAEVMREVFGKVEAEILATLPRGVCIVYRGHVVSSFDYGGGRRGGAKA